MKPNYNTSINLLLSILTALLVPSIANAQAKPAPPECIKSYCIDFNWAVGSKRGFAKPGTWKDADPKAHVKWYKDVGANVIQTFAVSCNGYAWYKSDVIPAQPGLKHDFLTEMVKQGHAEGMKVMGYFCIAANSRWGKENPKLSYGTPSTRHIPYTDQYLDYLSTAITDAIKTTGIDGFMIDWVWMPHRLSTKGKWIDAEKKLYQQLMEEPFPGEDKLTKKKELAYGQKSIDRCWKTIRKAAKEANPNCIIWLTTNKIDSPLVADSAMYKEVDWLMGEQGKLKGIVKLRSLVGKNTQLITCFSNFGGGDAAKDVPEAIKAGLGLYGYAKTAKSDGTIDLNQLFPKQLSELYGNGLRIAVLARAYRGMSIDAIWQDGKFIEGESPPFRIKFRTRRGWSDTARVDVEKAKATISVNTPYRSGRALISREGSEWPSDIVVHLIRKPTNRPASNDFRVANGKIGISIIQNDGVKVIAGKMEGNLELQKTWQGKGFLNGGNPEKPIKIGKVQASTTDQRVEIVIPKIITEGNPPVICFEWGVDGIVR